jgi:mono/diheme cytochrome c family protein
MVVAACTPAVPPQASPTPAATVGVVAPTAVVSVPSPSAAASVVAKPAASPSAAASPSPLPAAKPAASPAVAASPVVAAAAGPAPAGNASHGQEVFVQIGCSACHGTVGQGASTGPRLAPNPLPYTAFSGQVRQPRQDMPRFAPQFLSDQDLADIYAYLQSIQPGPQATAIPLLNR